MGDNLDDSGRPSKRIRTDRCANPFGIEGHLGTTQQLRRMSKGLLKAFPHFPESARICTACRMRYNQETAQNSQTSGEAEREYISSAPTNATREADLEELLQGLKDKFHSLLASDPMRVSILTIAPETWSVRKISDEFNTSRSMAAKAKSLRKSRGILAMPDYRSGKHLPEETVQKVREFYEDDRYSRVMPHKKETVTVRIGEEKQKMQKRLLLSDIKDLYELFCTQHPECPIGTTKFAELRPKWCVIAGSSGTHSVCVCTTHHNFEAMFEAANLVTFSQNKEFPLANSTDCMKFVLCENPSPSCYLGECPVCPDISKFNNYLLDILEAQHIDHIMFSTWQAMDRCTLIKDCLPTADFVDQLGTSLKNLIPHHFLSKAQSNYIAQRKSELHHDEVMVQCDFAENYAYIAQNSAQAFHYNNDQCTVLTVVLYYKNQEELKHKSIVLLSNSTTHDTAAVNVMQQTIMPEIRVICPQVRKIIYVTDGAKQHFKNRFQMHNLMHHIQDYGIEAEWHFHATAHGKGACDGLGAAVKREATRASLQADSNAAILDVETLFTWARAKFENIQFFFYSQQDHQRAQRRLTKRFSDSPQVAKIQSCHGFAPSGSTLKVFRYSNAEVPMKCVQYNIQ